MGADGIDSCRLLKLALAKKSRFMPQLMLGGSTELRRSDSPPDRPRNPNSPRIAFCSELSDALRHGTASPKCLTETGGA